MSVYPIKIIFYGLLLVAAEVLPLVSFVAFLYLHREKRKGMKRATESDEPVS